ncbi:hypothetical protein [Niveispirillum sp.]|uniref:hypothetical protein n=1 Tax=Niveispirillum sp. TaxID=1917217 RepID=UPI001B5C0048|nr:hypothetical protein [Niveispirillum sp.]MBP7337689.1 hypothetical protein [Niveispirillum sp.]
MRNDPIRHLVDRVLVYIAEHGASNYGYSVDLETLKRDLQISKGDMQKVVITMLNLGYLAERGELNSIGISSLGLSRASQIADHVAWEPPPTPPTLNHVTVHGSVHGNIQQAGAHSRQHSQYDAGNDAALGELITALRSMAAAIPAQQFAVIDAQIKSLESAKQTKDKGALTAILRTLPDILGMVTGLPVGKIIDQAKALYEQLQD